MTRTRRSIRSAMGASLAVGALVAASVFGLAASASAHNYLISSTPKAGSTLTALPSKFVITTNEGLLDLSGHGAGFALQVKDAAGKFYGDGCVTVTGPAMSVPAALGPAGKYTVIWQIVSADGHVVSDTYGFTWSPPASFTPAKGSATAPNCNGRSGGSAVVSSSKNTASPNPGNANLGLVLGIGGGVVGLGVILTVVLLLVGRRKRPTPTSTP